MKVKCGCSHKVYGVYTGIAILAIYMYMYVYTYLCTCVCMYNNIIIIVLSMCLHGKQWFLFFSISIILLHNAVDA